MILVTEWNKTDETDVMVLACINLTYFEWCEHHSHISHIRHVTWRDGQFKLLAEKIKNTVLQTSKHNCFRRVTWVSGQSKSAAEKVKNTEAQPSNP